jgi:uncharacterized protein YydD (DUF2326 family)
MITAVKANQATFRPVEFRPGFNVVLADRTKESSKKDSRNGLGKSTLIDVIHFCLGSGTRAGQGLRVPQLRGWSFTLELVLSGRAIAVSRSTDDDRFVVVQGDTSGWAIEPDAHEGRPVLAVADWTRVLGTLMFGLPVQAPTPYVPTFRSLISYVIRRGRDAFTTPFEHYRKQSEWDKQVANAFLLGLSWEDARDFQLLKDKEALLGKLKSASKAGLMDSLLGSVGELEAEKVRLEQRLTEKKRSLGAFRVLPEYRTVEAEANALTAEAHDLVNRTLSQERLLSLYQTSLRDERHPDQDDVVALFRQAGVDLPGALVRKLEEVKEFHNTVLSNRRSFLEQEIVMIRRAIADRSRRVEELTEKKQNLLSILKAHGALEELTVLQRAALETEGALRDVVSRISNLKRFDEGKSAVRIDRELLTQRARRDYQEREDARQRAIMLFNENSEALYEAPGRLAIDVTPTGFKFDVEIERSGSLGVSSMKVFCYDMAIAEIWASHPLSPRLLVHDSSIFADVDERQVAHALELAARKSSSKGFQYICTLNSDAIPTADFSPGFSLDPYVRMRLTDADETGCLLGVRF